MVREGRQHCFLTNTGCVGCVCRVRMGTGPLATLSCLCLSCHTFIVPLAPVHSYLRFYLRDLQLVSSKAAFPLSEVKEGRAMVAEMLGGVVCPAGWELPLSPCVAWSSRAHKSVTGGRLVSTPANRNALAQGDKHSVSTHCSRGSVLRLYRER